MPKRDDARSGWLQPLPQRAAFALLVLLAVGAALALGGIFAYATGVLTICGGALLLLAPLPKAPRQGARLLLGLGAFIALYTLITLIPLPLGLLTRLAPAQAEVWARALHPLGLVPAHGTLSLDPTATAIELAKLLLYGCTYLVALGLAERRHGSAALERLVYGVTALLVLVSLGHWAIGERAVFGVYEPDFKRDPRHVTVLLNTNHLAEVMAIGASVAAGVLASSKTRARQIEASIVLAVATLGSALAASRGGLVALVAGVSLAFIGGRGRLDAKRARLLVLGALVVGATAVSVIAASEHVTREAFSTGLEKLDIFRQSLPLLFRYGLFGIGRGAFESVSPEARRDLGSFVFTHPENLLLQWSIEWGIVVTVGILLVLARAIGPGVLRGRAVMPWGAYGALFAFALQNQVDFGSEVPAIAVLVICCLALVTGGARAVPAEPSRPPWWRRAPRLLGVAAIASGLQVLVTADHELWNDSRELARTVSEPAFPAELRAAMERHPAEAHLAFLGAMRARHEGRSVIPWVTRTLERSPVHGRAHLLLALELERLAPAQARLEYRLAYAEDYRTHLTMLAAVPRVARDFDDALDLVPRRTEAVASSSAAGTRVISVSPATRTQAALAVATALHDTLPGSQERLLRWLVAEDGPSPATIGPLASAAVVDVASQAPWCEDEREARSLVQTWVDIAPHEEAPRVAAATLLARVDPQGALAWLLTAETVVDHPEQLLLAGAELAARTGQGDRVGPLLDRAANRCSGIEECRPVLARGAALEESRGRPEGALVLIRRETELAPSEAGVWRRRAALAEKLGLYTEAEEAFEQVVVLEPNASDVPAAVARVRSAQRTRSLPKLPTP